jgi:hypothetical protein
MRSNREMVRSIVLVTTAVTLLVARGIGNLIMALTRKQWRRRP